MAIEHGGEHVPLVSKMTPPFAGEPGENVGMTHLLGDDAMRIASTPATLRQ